MFAHAETEVAAAVGIGQKVWAAADDRLVAGCKVGAAADEICDDGREGVESIAAGVTGSRAATAVEGGQGGLPAVGKLAVQHRAELGGQVGMGGGVGVPQFAVVGFEPFAALDGLEAEFTHVVGQIEGRFLRPF